MIDADSYRTLKFNSGFMIVATSDEDGEPSGNSAGLRNFRGEFRGGTEAGTSGDGAKMAWAGGEVAAHKEWAW